jgi:hypothetical protein
VLWSIAAGPLVNLVLVVPTLVAWHYGTAQGWHVELPDVYRYVVVLFWINLFIFIFNMLPIYPLDGGQILQALLWFGLGRWRSLQVASLTGIFFGGALFLLTLLFGVAWNLGMEGIILGVLALFIVFRSLVGLQQSRAVLFLLSLPRHEECACPHCGMNPPRGTFWVCSEHCQARFDLFDARGRCPACGAWYLKPECPHCGRGNHVDRWFRPTAEVSEEAPARTAITPNP